MAEDPYLAVLRLRVRQAREARGLRQEDVAEVAGLPLRVYQRMEGAGAYNPTVLTLRSVAHGLGLTMPDLTGEPTSDEFEATVTLIPRRPGRPARSKGAGR